ncbi:Hypothetical predicted protein, partial [Mytilus galloprovincialis]
MQYKIANPRNQKGCLLKGKYTILDVKVKRTKRRKRTPYDTIKPGFDHNLRDHHGNTPLMVACNV